MALSRVTCRRLLLLLDEGLHHCRQAVLRCCQLHPSAHLDQHHLQACAQASTHVCGMEHHAACVYKGACRRTHWMAGRCASLALLRVLRSSHPQGSAQHGPIWDCVPGEAQTHRAPLPPSGQHHASWQLGHHLPEEVKERACRLGEMAEQALKVQVGISNRTQRKLHPLAWPSCRSKRPHGPNATDSCPCP